MIFRNDKRPKTDLLIKEDFLPVYRKFLASHNVTYNDTDELWDLIDNHNEKKIEFD